MDDDRAVHECVFPEEREPSGRLILGPCLVCHYSAVDALEQVRGALVIADKTLETIRFLAENDQLDGIKNVFREPPHLRAMP